MPMHKPMSTGSRSRGFRTVQLSFIALAALLAFAFSQRGVHAADQADITSVDQKAIQSMLDQNKGKVVLLNYFASWCVPCHAEFPDIVKLYSKYKDQGLNVIGVSMNDITEKPDMVSFIKEMKPTFTVYLEASNDDDFYKAVGNPTEELPMSQIYDRSGKLVNTYQKALSYAEFEQAVTPLLAAK